MLEKTDVELYTLIQGEKRRQQEGINLIASENSAREDVLECLGSCLTNKYSEGQPGQRYYGGNHYIDEIERLCQKRCLQAFGLREEDWGINVQALSGTSANLAVYMAFLKPHDRFMALALTHGGHLSHGFYTKKKKVSASSMFYETLPYHVDLTTGYIDFKQLERDAHIFQPKLIVCGASAYPRTIEFHRFRQIADSLNNGCVVMADISHIAGLIAGEVHPSPFIDCDVVTTTTHKTLRGPRSALIFVNKKRLGEKMISEVNQAVFPGLHGGPHNNQIAAVACQMKHVADASWKLYAQRIVANAQALAQCLKTVHHQTLITGGTDTHIILWDLRPSKLSGIKLEKLAEAVCLYVNRNTIPGDVSALVSSGVRLGTPMITSLGYTVDAMSTVAGFLMECLHLAIDIQNQQQESTLSEFLALLAKNDKILILKKKVLDFAAARGETPIRSS